MVEHLHPDSLGPARNVPTYPAQADDSHGLSTYPPRRRDTLAAPSAGADKPVGFADAPHHREGHRNGRLRDVFPQLVGGMGNPDVPPRCLPKVDLLEADALADDELQIRARRELGCAGPMDSGGNCDVEARPPGRGDGRLEADEIEPCGERAAQVGGKGGKQQNPVPCHDVSPGG